jgi:WD40 repeat protein
LISVAQKNDNKIRVWSINEQSIIPVDEFSGHNDVVKSFDWRISSSADGKDSIFQIVSLSNDNTLKVWPIDHLLQEDCGASKYSFAPDRAKDSVKAQEVNERTNLSFINEEIPFKSEFQTLLESMANMINISSVFF